MKNIMLLILVGVFVSGCAVQTLIKKRNLDVQTKMSHTVFLEPVAPQDQIVYLRVRNTTDKDIDISAMLKQAFIDKNYTITTDPAIANFIVQVNLLKIGNGDKRSKDEAIGSVVAGGALGSLIGSRSNRGLGVIIGAALGFAGDALVDDTYFEMITDIEIRQRNLQQKDKWTKHQTKIVSVANKANLDFIDAKDKLVDGLLKSVSGIL